MTIEEFERLTNEQHDIMTQASEERKRLEKVFIESNAKFKIGQKVNTQRGEGIVAEVSIFVRRISYRVNKITKDGNMSRNTLEYYANESELTEI